MKFNLTVERGGGPLRYCLLYTSITEHQGTHMGKRSSHIKDPRYFVQIIKSLPLKMSNLLVIFDMRFVFTKAPILETVDFKKRVRPSFYKDHRGLPEFL